MSSNSKFKTWKTVTGFCAAGLLVILLAACGAARPQAASAPTQTARANNMVALATQMGGRLAATSQAMQAYIQKKDDWPVVMSEAFQDNAAEWPVGPDDGDLVSINLEVSPGRYTWKATTKESFVYWVHPEIQSVTDFYLTAEMTQVSGPSDGAHGVFFRLAGDDEYYLFLIDGEQDYTVVRSTVDGWVTLVDWQYSPAIQPGTANRVTVVGIGPLLVFYINDQYLASVQDTVLPAGQAGLAISLYGAGTEAEVQFTNFELRGVVVEE